MTLTKIKLYSNDENKNVSDVINVPYSSNKNVMTDHLIRTRNLEIFMLRT